jgi:hypothetical protein
MEVKIMLTRSILLVTFTLSTLTGLVSCQSFNSPQDSVRRYIANIGPIRFEKFIDDIVLQSRNSGTRVTKAQAEKKALAYIKANHKKLGLSKVDADNIKSVYDDIPAMNNIHKHLTRHITDILPINSNIAQKAYKSIIQSPGSINPYSTQGRNLRNSTLAARNNNSPNAPINFDDAILRSEIRTIDDVSVRRIHQKNYKLSQKRMVDDPIAAASINQSLDSSVVVYKRTGHPAVGKGCGPFVENASAATLKAKAEADELMAIMVEERAFNKAGGPFSSIDEVPLSKRLTLDEIDEIREEVFAKTFNYTKQEAKTAVSRLKRAPCQVY